MNRRSFLKFASAAVVATVGVPLFIPAERLEFGVPKPIALTEPVEYLKIIGGEVTWRTTGNDPVVFESWIDPDRKGMPFIAEYRMQQGLDAARLMSELASTPQSYLQPYAPPLSGLDLALRRAYEEGALADLYRDAADKWARIKERSR